VGVIHVTTMSMAVVPIFPMLVGSGRTHGLLRAGTITTKPGCLLWETNTTTTVATVGTAVAVATAVASVAAIVECVLLLYRGVDVGRGCWPTAMQNCWMFVNWPCMAAMVVAWDFIDSCVAAYAASKFASDSLYDAIDALSSMAAMPYPCCEAGAAVWLTSAIASAQYSLKESIVSAIGGVSFSRAIQFLYSSRIA
jgi:hypothetical protein